MWPFPPNFLTHLPEHLHSCNPLTPRRHPSFYPTTYNYQPCLFTSLFYSLGCVVFIIIAYPFLCQSYSKAKLKPWINHSICLSLACNGNFTTTLTSHTWNQCSLNLLYFISLMVLLNCFIPIHLLLKLSCPLPTHSQFAHTLLSESQIPYLPIPPSGVATYSWSTMVSFLHVKMKEWIGPQLKSHFFLCALCSVLFHHLKEFMPTDMIPF